MLNPPFPSAATETPPASLTDFKPLRAAATSAAVEVLLKAAVLYPATVSAGLLSKLSWYWAFAPKLEGLKFWISFTLVVPSVLVVTGKVVVVPFTAVLTGMIRSTTDRLS